MPQVINIQANLQWEVSRTVRGQYMGVCKALGLALTGENHADLRANIRDGLHLLFVTMVEENRFEAFLQQKGWQASEAPREDLDDLAFEVPFELIPREQRQAIAA